MLDATRLMRSYYLVIRESLSALGSRDRDFSAILFSGMVLGLSSLSLILSFQTFLGLGGGGKWLAVVTMSISVIYVWFSVRKYEREPEPEWFKKNREKFRSVVPFALSVLWVMLFISLVVVSIEINRQ